MVKYRDIVRIVQTSLERIREKNLHGYWNTVPEGFLRGVEILGDDLEAGILKACRGYHHHHKAVPNLIDPRTFTEKQVLFKFFGPVPDVPVADKLRSFICVPDTVRGLIRMPARPWVSDTTSLPENDDIPAGRYYFKSNHGSGTNFPVDFPITQRTRNRLQRRAQRWLTKSHGGHLALWWEDRMEHAVYLEEYLGDLDRDAPDWKFFVCNGRVEIFQVDVDRHSDHRQTIYNRDGTFLDQTLYYTKGTPLPIPDRLEDMVKVSEAIGANFDFVRVDLFLQNDDIMLGELAMVPNGANIRVQSKELDQRLDMAWHAPWFGQVDEGYSTGHYRQFRPGCETWNG